MRGCMPTRGSLLTIAHAMVVSLGGAGRRITCKHITTYNAVLMARKDFVES